MNLVSTTYIFCDKQKNSKVGEPSSEKVPCSAIARGIILVGNMFARCGKQCNWVPNASEKDNTSVQTSVSNSYEICHSHKWWVALNVIQWQFVCIIHRNDDSKHPNTSPASIWIQVVCDCVLTIPCRRCSAVSKTRNISNLEATLLKYDAPNWQMEWPNYQI